MEDEKDPEQPESRPVEISIRKEVAKLSPEGSRDGSIERPYMEDEPVNQVSYPLPEDQDHAEIHRRWLERDPERIGTWLAALHEAGDESIDWPEEPAEQLSKDLHDLPFDVDSHDLGEAGWTIVCREIDYPKYEKGLRDLIEHRAGQMGREVVPLLVEPHETWRTFLARHGESRGVIDPAKVPYYLLIVGSPEELSFEFQFGLSVDHAVGRLSFEDLEDFESYTARLTKIEDSRETRLDPRTVLFSVEDDKDYALDLLRDFLVDPLQKDLEGYVPGWTLEARRRGEATRGSLGELLGGPETPALFLFSGHGASYSKGADGQTDFQGALICRNAGDRTSNAFGATQLQEADLRGNISFFFACYGAGTPAEDHFPPPASRNRTAAPARLADRPFVARLPQALLAQGSLAIVGHVDRGWTLSFHWALKGGEISTIRSLEDTLKRLQSGDRLGHAMRSLNRRTSSLSAQLHEVLGWLRQGEKVNLTHLGRLWLAFHDARNFIVLGDPAVYLRGQRPKGAVIRLGEDLTSAAEDLAAEEGVSLEQVVLRILEEQLRERLES